MQIIATQKNVRQTPRKLRLVANQIKNLSLEQALRQLAVIERRSTIALLKTLRQAIADAQHNHGLEFKDLKINSIMIGDAARLKRFRAASRGRAHSIIKRSSHIRVVLETEKAEIKREKSAEEKKAARKTKIDLSAKLPPEADRRDDRGKKESSKKTTSKDAINRVSKSVGRVVKTSSQRTTNK